MNLMPPFSAHAGIAAMPPADGAGRLVEAESRFVGRTKDEGHHRGDGGLRMGRFGRAAMRGKGSDGFVVLGGV
ncbi:hypothetical protein ABTL39_19415, partial [Acinetobacter baumannii]